MEKRFLLNMLLQLCMLLLPLLASAQDGSDDIAVISREPDNFSYITRNPGNDTDSWSSKLGENQEITFLSGNFNGDGADDIACVDFDATDDPFLFVKDSPGDANSTLWTNALRSGNQYFYYFLTGDFDGDGNDDVATFYRDYAGADPVEDVRAKITYGPTGVSATNNGQDWQFPGQRKAAFVTGYFKDSDLADGVDAADIVAFYPFGASYRTRIFEGPDGTADVSEWTVPLPDDNGGTPDVAAVGAGDFNGDGHYDIAAVYFDTAHSTPNTYTAVIVFGPSGAAHTDWTLGTDQFIHINFGDFDGDSYSDIAGIIGVQGGDRSANIFRGSNTGAVNGTATWTLAGDHTATAFIVGDFGRKLSTISGTVFRQGGTLPLPGIVVSLKNNLGNVVATDTTEANGTFEFTGVSNGTYTVEPSQHANFNFNPQTRAVTISNANVANVNFVAQIDPAIYAISGQVTSYLDNTPLAGVTVTATSSNGGFTTTATTTTTTDSNGNYTFTVTLGTFTVTPSWHADVQFAPSNRQVTISNASVGGVNFTDTGADQCVRDPLKTAQGACGCGVTDTDTDGDGVPNCLDQCPTNVNKQTVGACGCSWSREEEDLNDNNVPDCNETEPLYTVSGSLFIMEDGIRKRFFINDDESKSGIKDIWVWGRRGNKHIGKVKVNRTDSSFRFANLPATEMDSRGRPKTIKIGGVEHAEEGYTFWVNSYDQHYSVSRQFQMHRDTSRTGFGCAESELDVLDRTKDVMCRFDPLVLNGDFPYADMIVNGCIDDTIDGGRRIIGREMGKGRRCFETIDEDNRSRTLVPTAPSNLVASRGTLEEGVSLTWTSSSRVDYYSIFRSQYPEDNERYRRAHDRFMASSEQQVGNNNPPIFNGQAIKLEVFPVSQSSTTVFYLDRTAVPGVKYDYVVQAFNPAGGSLQSNAAEGWRMADSAIEDSDGDLVSDKQEDLDGTDILDPGSKFVRLDSPAFSKYNTFYNQENWLELINTGTVPLSLTVTIYDQLGNKLGEPAYLGLQVGQQFDFDIRGHLQAFFTDVSNRYGMVKVTFNKSDRNAKLRGRMAVYRANPGEENLPDTERTYSFAFPRELRNRVRGTSFATANTYDPQGMRNLVPNWLEIINLDDVPRKFTQRIYNMQGNLLYDSESAVGTDGVTLPSIEVPARGEVDVQAGHEFGENVYLVELIPHDGATNYIASIVRYSSNSQATDDSITFNFAMPIEARYGSGDVQYVPIGNRSGACWLQTNWVEVVNVREKPVSAQIRFRDHFGVIRGETPIFLRPYGQEHLNASAMLPAGFIGQTEIVPSDPGSILAQSNTYFHDCKDNKTQTAYASPSQTPRKFSLIGSYNSFYGMQNLLRVMNTGGEPVNYNLDVMRTDQLARQAHALSPFQTMELNLNTEQFSGGVMPPNSYGPITIQSSSSAPSLVGENVRIRLIDDGVDFAIPTPVQ